MRVQSSFGAAILAAVVLGAGAAPVAAQKSADTLRISMRDALPNVDPYYNNLRTGVVMHHQAWDALVYRNPDTFKLEPLLASEWSRPDPTTIEFTLRPGVKFHDGSPLTRRGRGLHAQSRVRPGEQGVDARELQLDRQGREDRRASVRVKLKRPTPAALEYFALVLPIYPKAYRERVGAEAYAKAPVGAGPYKITKVEPVVSIEFERFEDYWAGSPKGKPTIKKMTVRFVPDATTEMTELLAGSADWIWNLNPDQFDHVEQDSAPASRAQGVDAGRLSRDRCRRPHRRRQPDHQAQGAPGDLARDRPPGDRRQARHRREPRSARPCFPPQFGCDGETAVHYDYDPAKAKALLAEAGYPNGFDVELASYVLPQWGSAIQNYLQAVGIRAKLNQLQVAALVSAREGRRVRMYLGSWGSYSINDVSAILPNFFDGGADDYARDPDVQKWLVDAGSSNDAEARKKAYSVAIQRITERAYWAPLHTYVTTYGHAKQLDFTPYADELPRFFLAKWK